MDLSRTLRKIGRESAFQSLGPWENNPLESLTEDPEGAVRQILERQRKIEDQRQELRQKYDRAADKVRELEIELARTLAQCRRLRRSEADAGTAVVAPLREEKAKTDRNLEQTRAALALQENAIGEARSEAERLRRQRDESLESIRERDAELDTLRANLDENSREIERIRSNHLETIQAEDQRVARKSDEVEQAMIDVASARDQARTARVERESVAAELAEALETIDTTATERGDLERDLQRVREERDRSRTDVSEARAEQRGAQAEPADLGHFPSLSPRFVTPNAPVVTPGY